MRIALGLLTLATVLAAVVAYGTHPAWAQYQHGLTVIEWSRVAQWPALFLSLAAALGVSTDDISWDHAVPVEHLRGNGPQTGRAT